MTKNFHCEELTIHDEELGCTIIFSDSRSADDQFKTDEELMNSVEKYLLIQRTYAEDEYDQENYHIESSESNKDLNSYKEILLKINDDRLEAKWSGERILIGLNLKKQEFEKLIRILNTKFKDRLTIRKK